MNHVLKGMKMSIKRFPPFWIIRGLTIQIEFKTINHVIKSIKITIERFHSF